MTVQSLVLDCAISSQTRTSGFGEQVDVLRVGGLERREPGRLPFGLVRGVAAGGHEAQHPAGRVDPGGAEGGPGPVDQPGAVLRYQHVVRRPV
ncbi:MAG TPA: hypothetical protein VG142_04440 [Trebonia sp.]|nr:hypothetical protein [Trebonia sp.]